MPHGPAAQRAQSLRRPLKVFLRLERLEARDCPSSGYYFTDATNTGIVPTSLIENDGNSWVDVNGDGRPDLWIGGEMMAKSELSTPPNLYINNGNGTFTDAFSTAFPPDNPLAKLNDAEGSAWADFFNTGTPDLLQSSGGVGGKSFKGSFFFVNRQGQFTEEAAVDGLQNGVKTGREPVFLDWNHDGLLDAIVLEHQIAKSGSATLYSQTPTGFVTATNQAGLGGVIKDPAVAESVDLNGDGVPDLVVLPANDSGKGPLFFAGNVGAPGFTLQPNFLPYYHDITDMAVGDFFNTGYNDIFFTRRFDNQSDVEQAGPNVIAAHLIQGAQTGFTFQSSGTLSFDLNLPAYSQVTGLVDQIFIGSQGYHPAGLPFTLDPNDPNNQGIVPHNTSMGQGLYIGYDTASQTWQVYYTNNTPMSPFVLNMSQPVSNLTPVGFDPNAAAMQPEFLVYNPVTKTYQNKTIQAGLATPIMGGSVVAGDFNNDGLLDIYVQTQSFLADKGGILYLNNGNGTFTAVPGLPPQPGVFYADQENHVGRRVAMADYNGDGTLDLFIPNTKLETPSFNYYAGPNELVYNPPNGNNWVEFNLQGVESNREAIGAVVYLTSGGVTQRRDVTDGRHLGAQNWTTVQFGLGQNTTIDQVVIDWPSGIVQTLTNVPIDQLQTIVEPGGHSMTQARPISIFSPNQTYNGNLDTVNTQDFYQFTAGRPVTVQLFLTGQAQIQLLDQSGNVLAQSQTGPSGQQDLTINEPIGTYYIQVLLGQAQPGSYSLNVDALPLAPLISNLVISPLKAAAPPITITATAALGVPGNGFVAGAEFFIDGVGDNGTGIPMAAQDGSFDEPTEVVTGTIDGALFASLASRHHILYLHAMDNQGDWGPVISEFFFVDTEGPVTLSLAVNPSQASTPPTITARVSDKGTGLSKVATAEYFIDTPGANGTGTALTLGKLFDGGVIRLVSGTIDPTVFSQLSLGQHTLYVNGEDSLGNWGPLVSTTFTVIAGQDAMRLGGPLGGAVATLPPAEGATPPAPTAASVSSREDGLLVPESPAPPTPVGVAAGTQASGQPERDHPFKPRQSPQARPWGALMKELENGEETE
jgi:hypothetical protein